MPMSPATLKSMSTLPKPRKVKPNEDRAKMQRERRPEVHPEVES